MKNAPFLPILAGWALAAWAVLAGGCNSASVQRDLMMEEATADTFVERPVAMKGEGSFLAGSLAATATVQRGFERVDPRGESGPPRQGGPKEVEEDTSNSFAHVYFATPSEEEEKAAMEAYARQAQAMRAAGSPMPPVTLKVQLQNKGTEPMEVEIREVNSDLGNFAPRPSNVTIGPGGTVTLDPMISQLGVTSDEIPLKLGVRTGGRTETQVVHVKNVITAAGQKHFEELQQQQKKKKRR
jgi:hypothetical protein